MTAENTEITAKSFKGIYYSLYPRLLSFSLKYVKDQFVAEEVVEDCMLYLWERRKELESVKDLKSYLYTMVKNRCFTYLRNNHKEIPLEAVNYEAISQEDQYIIEEETHAILMKAIEELPDKCKKVFKMSCIEGVRYKDIALEMDISVNTVKSQRSRAIELLKRSLKDQPFVTIYLSILLKTQIF
ncbi:RNA polymerase sigma-70 factor [Aestuariibaculum suncheonense]|uniref:RNA polymerase sigma-70 factor n=1 Tax=Aestuariibaculum suncheonense TaxID=1028745 RepID=A0A8J6UAK7_9FLAO|nr:RNA polymerase sigma-70 factor [Aestuariibaculum suncheonense]MBD0834512.1 RNA polymerase sigma-70 factor [Aestuariibaculum suncheonense]